MAANIGRKFAIKRGSTTIAGVRSKSAAFSGEPVDITSDDDAGFRTILDEEGVRSVDLNIEGVTKDNDIRSAALSGGSLMLTDVNLVWPNGDTMTGNFFLSGIEETGATQDAMNFSATLLSSGEWAYTATSV